MRVLVVEDEPDLARTLRKALEEEHFAVDVASDGEEALYFAREGPYDAIVLDLLLPGRDGWSVLREVRADGLRVPVIILTARDEVADKVRGLDLGADDYLTKPFALAELLARVRSAIRRGAGAPAPRVSIGDITIDTVARRVLRGDVPVTLTAREYGILEFLALRRGQLVPRSAICDHLYDDEADVSSNVIEVHVAAIRRKLGRDVIITRRGLGYIIEG